MEIDDLIEDDLSILEDGVFLMERVLETYKEGGLDSKCIAYLAEVNCTCAYMISKLLTEKKNA